MFIPYSKFSKLFRIAWSVCGSNVWLERPNYSHIFACICNHVCGWNVHVKERANFKLKNCDVKSEFFLEFLNSVLWWWASHLNLTLDVAKNLNLFLYAYEFLFIQIKAVFSLQLACNVALSGNSMVTSGVKLEFWVEEILEIQSKKKGLWKHQSCLRIKR